jgi:hypothetical protein
LALLISIAAAGRVLGQEANLLANGSFEFWSQWNPDDLPRMLKEGPSFENDDPLLPMRWEWRMGKPTRLMRSSDAHGGHGALSLDNGTGGGGGGQLSLGMLEVVPEATYTFGVWAKGSAKVRVWLVGHAVEGGQTLGSAEGQAAAEWLKIGGSVTIPGHIRTVTLAIDVRGDPKDLKVLLDDAFIAAPLDVAYDADAVLKEKYRRDSRTLLFAEFEQDDPAIKVNGKDYRVAEHVGRFGRGLRVTRTDLAMIPLRPKEMPAEGTLECWLSPDHVGVGGDKASCFLTVQAAGTDLASLFAQGNAGVSWHWRTDGGYSGDNQVLSPWGVSIGRLRKGQWMHVALAWDAAAVRLYLDGVLAAITTKGRLPWFGAFDNITINRSDMAHSLLWAGLIDEIRVSDVKRYGPMVPKGAVWKPLPAAKAPPPAAPKAQESKPSDYAAGRAKLLGQVAPTQPGAFEDRPDANGDYVYEATSAKPLVNHSRFEVEHDKVVDGLTTVWIGRAGGVEQQPEIQGLYWTLGKIQAGEYWLGILYQSNQGTLEGPQTIRGRMTVMHNGRVAQLMTTSDPVQVAPGVWLAEAQTGPAVALRSDDEIEVMPQNQQPLRVVRLLLHPREPARGPHKAPMNFGAHWWSTRPSLSVVAEQTFLDAKTQGVSAATFLYYEQKIDGPENLLRDTTLAGVSPAVAQVRVSNPLPAPVTLEYECLVKGYYGQVAGRDAERIVLPPHTSVVRRVKFQTTPDDPSYTMITRLKAIKPPDLGWPESQMLPLFPLYATGKEPGLRQYVPWDDPFGFVDVRRLFFLKPLKDIRQTISLNGEWQKAHTPDLQPPMPAPKDLTWEACRVPLSVNGLNSLKPRPHGMYVRRVVELPQEATDKTYRLIVKKVVDEATAYVNGVKVGNLRGTDAPLVADITGQLRPGKNEIVIVVRDLLAIMNPDYVNPQSPTPNPAYLDAPGLFGMNSMGMEDVSIESAPAISADDILVLPSVRNKRLGVRASLVNHSNKPVKVRVKATVLDARMPVFEVGQEDVDLAVDRPVELAFEKPWSEPHLWAPLDPHLYVLAVEITDLATGQVVDLARERFGFRESWVVGPNLYFNGNPVKLKGWAGRSSHGLRGDIVYNRHTGGLEDYYDETGQMVSEFLTGVFNSSSRHNVERDAFWDNARHNMLTHAKRMQNHPSIICWDMSNEWLSFLGYSGGDPLAGARRLKALSTELAKQDPTRWTFYNGDEDLHGLHDTYSGHYMLEATYPGPMSGFRFNNGRSCYFPDAAFWRPLTGDFGPGQRIVLNVHSAHASIAWGEKVVMNTENLWKTGSYMPPGFTRIVGEDDVLGPAVDGQGGPIAWFWKQNIDGHRDLGMNSISPYPGHPGLARGGYALQTFILPDTRHHAFSGAHWTLKYDLLNDLFTPAKFVFSWTLRNAATDRVTLKGKDKQDMQSAGLTRGELSLIFPPVKQREVLTLSLRLEADGKFVYGEERDIEVWPDQPAQAGTLARKVLLFDPARTTADPLRKAGVPFETIKTLAAPDGDANTVALVIGESALDESDAAAVGKLAAFIEAGGRLLILAQNANPGPLPAVTKLEPRLWASQLFVRMGSHPILQGIRDWDLHFWSPDRVSARGAYGKPEGGGPAVTLVDSGGESGLEWVQMAELYRGNGLYLLCQLSLARSYDVEPMARELLARTVRYVAGTAPMLQPTRRLTAIVNPEGPIANRLRELEIAFDVAEPGAKTESGPLLIEAGVAATEAQRAAWHSAIESGATAVVVGAGLADAPWLSKLAGTEVRLTVPRYAMWEGRGYRRGFSPLTAGLSQVDLYWKRYDGGESGAGQGEYPGLKIEPFQDTAVQIHGARELVFPDAMVELPVGKGRLVIDQRRWFTRNDKLARLAKRNACALALGLNVSIAPVQIMRGLPADVSYKPIDLTGVANRSLADDVGEDGKGGWSDQGPDCDLRSFPTGLQPFQGVPFSIGKDAQSCVVLASTLRQGAKDMPSEVTIPLGYAVEGFYFLHSSAWTAGRVALYQVQYADGTSIDIPLIYDVNIRDWTSGESAFVRERQTKSNVAWTGSNKVFSNIAVYRMLWVNPNPQTPVKSLRFSNATGASVVMLLGLTAVLPREQKDVVQAAAQARGLLAGAMKAVEAKDDKKAEPLFKEALRVDPTLMAAHQALADLCERAGNDEATLAAYRAWTAAGANTPLPYNRIGEILESRKDYKGALEAYSRSLKIEWNQPPVMEARGRMEKLVP